MRKSKQPGEPVERNFRRPNAGRPRTDAAPEMSREEKQAVFLDLVCPVLQALTTSRLIGPNVDDASRAREAFHLARELSTARDVAKRIPGRLEPIEAASDFIQYVFECDMFGNEVKLAKWMKLKTVAELLAQGGPTETLIDRKWIVLPPEWEDLPYNDSNSLKLMCRIRGYSISTLDELKAVVPEASHEAVRRCLRRIEREGWAERSGKRPDEIWTATYQLKQTAPAGSTVIDNAPSKQVLREAEWKRAREERLRNLPHEPNAKAILAAIRDGGPASVRELWPIVPQLERTALVRLLKRLRDADHLQVAGDRRNALWGMAGEVIVARPAAKPAPRTKIPEAEGAEPSEPIGPRRRVPKPLDDEEYARVERFVMEHPGCRFGEIATGLGYEANRLRYMIHRLWGHRRLYNRRGLHYPGVDPRFEV